MLRVLKQRNFLLAWTAGLISATGDWVLAIALPIYVYTVTGSALATSATFAVELLPAVVFGSVAGIFVDRWPRKRVMLITNVLLALSLLPLLWVQSAGTIWIVYPVAFAQSVISRFAKPAEAALLPTLVHEDLLIAANSLASLNSETARLLGPALGGLIAVSMGIAGITMIDAASFLGAAGLVFLLRLPPTPRTATRPEIYITTGWHTTTREWLDGMTVVRTYRGLRIVLGAITLGSLGEGVMGTIFVIWVKHVLGGSALELGWFMSAQAVGGIIGGLIIGAIASGVNPHRLAWISVMSFALLDVMLFAYPLAFTSIWIGLGLICVVGIPATGYGAGVTTLLQLTTPDVYRGRIFGALETTTAMTRLLGTIIAGICGSIVSPIALLVMFQGGSYLLAGFLLLGGAASLVTLRNRVATHPVVVDA